MNILTTHGINQWDEEWEVGDLDTTTGQPRDSTVKIRSKNYVEVMPNTAYRFYSGSEGALQIFFFDANKALLSRSWNDGYVLTTPNTCKYTKFVTETAYGTTYKNDISFNYPSSITTYQPYERKIMISNSKAIVPTNGAEWLGNVKFNQLAHDFSDISNWQISKFNYSQSGRSIRLTSTAAWAPIIANANSIDGHIYYERASVVRTTNVYGIYWYSPTGNLNFGWTKDKVTRDLRSTVPTDKQLLHFGAESSGEIFDLMDVISVDLTEMFGAGNEPTIEVCRKLFSEPYYEYNAGTNGRLAFIPN